MSIDDCDVLIVGAGPVGLLLALILHAKGVNVKIVERQKALYPLPRAVAFDHESRRVMGSLDLTKELEPILQNMLFKGGDSGTNYLWRDADLKSDAMAFCQPELESVLNQAAIDRQIPILRGYTISDLEEKGDKMDVLLEAVIMKQGQTIEERDFSQVFDPSAYGHSHLRLGASYVVGCDGANSTVHRLMKFTNTDLNFENDWLVIDLLLQDGYIPPRVARVGCCQVCDPARPTTIVSGGHGRKRFEFMRLPHETKEDILRDDTIWDLLQSWGFNKGNCQLERKVVYTFRARWANAAFKGRVMLAGDALHLMPPFMGQGLNSGLRDAAALG